MDGRGEDGASLLLAGGLEHLLVLLDAARDLATSALSFGRLVVGSISPLWLYGGAISFVALYAALVLALLYVMFFGAVQMGARRWIALGPLNLQPSEFAKPAFVIVAAWFLAEHTRRPEMPGHFLALLFAGAFIGLLIMQPDFGQTMLAVNSDDGRLIKWDLKTHKGTTLVDRFQGHRFNSPNDLVVDRKGGVYFTEFGNATVKTCVYYIRPDGIVIKVADDIERPNGVKIV